MTSEMHTHKIVSLHAGYNESERIVTLTPKVSGCGAERVKALGHIIGHQGMRPHPRKAEAVNKLQLPREVKGVRSVLGLCVRTIWLLAGL